MGYNETTIIGDKHIILTQEEKKGTEEFHLNRVAFAILQDGSVAFNIKDVREHMVYLQEDYGISMEECDKLIRGYIAKDRVVFYRGRNFAPIDTEIPKRSFNIIMEQAIAIFGENPYKLWDGVAVGEPGTPWPPINEEVYITEEELPLISVAYGNTFNGYSPCGPCEEYKLYAEFLRLNTTYPMTGDAYHAMEDYLKKICEERSLIRLLADFMKKGCFQCWKTQPEEDINEE